MSRLQVEASDRSRAKKGLSEVVAGLEELQREVESLVEKRSQAEQLKSKLNARYIELRTRVREIGRSNLALELVLSPEYLEQELKQELKKVEFGIADDPKARASITNLELVKPAKSNGAELCTVFGMDQIGVRAQVRFKKEIPDIAVEFGLGLSFADKIEGRFYLARDAYECKTSRLSRKQLMQFNSVLRGKVDGLKLPLPNIVPNPGTVIHNPSPTFIRGAEIDELLRIYYYRGSPLLPPITDQIRKRISGGGASPPPPIRRLNRLPNGVHLAAKVHVGLFGPLIGQVMKNSRIASDVQFGGIIGPIRNPPGFLCGAIFRSTETVCTKFEVHFFPITDMRSGCTKWETQQITLPVFFQCKLVAKKVGKNYELYGRVEFGDQSIEEKITTLEAATDVSFEVDDNSITILVFYNFT